MTIDRNRVGRAFHCHAAEYDQNTPVQKRVAEELLVRVRERLNAPPEAVLDIGCGTGRLLDAVGRQYPRSRLFGLDLAYNMTALARERLQPRGLLVNGDAAAIPFADRSFDLVVSSSTLQWLDDLDGFFQECQRVSREGGTVCVAFFGGSTLCELQECYRDALLQLPQGTGGRYAERLHRFRTIADVERSLKNAGFGAVSLARLVDTAYHSSVADLLRSMKRIGAGTPAGKETGGGLGWRGVLNETSRLYHQRYGSGGMIPATYESIVIVGNGRESI